MVFSYTVGPDFYDFLKGISRIRIESHLMVMRPDLYYKKFGRAGDLVYVHYESPINVLALLKRMRDEGVDAGLVINPDTPFQKVSDLLEYVQVLLIMSVYPGFSGQKFIDVSDKIHDASKENGFKTKIEVDGGINDNTARIVKNAGADIVVSASYIFGGNITERIRILSSI